MPTAARHAYFPALTLAALAVVVPVGHARADVDLTGSWNVYFQGGSSGVWNITQNGTTLTVTVPGETFGGFINPQTGSFQVYSPFTPCPVVFLATTSPDGNAFNGDVYNTVPSCPGGPNTCTCVASGPSTANGRGCRVGAGGDCCGDHVVGATEECDNGPEPADACCDATCHLRASGSSCTADANPCTDDVCNATGTCTHPALGAGTSCFDDQNACTTDACDGAGTCAHTPVVSGTPCADDGLFCTTDACDAGGSCAHTPLAAGTPCPDDGQVCTTDACDAGGTCTHTLVDVDGDGVCDVFDACVDGVALTKARLKVGRYGTPPGDDRLTVKGDMTPPPNPPLDPIADGLRLVLRDSPDGVFLDVTLPPGAYSAATRTGWKVRGTGFDFVTPQVVGGAVKAAHLRRPASLPGVVRVAISGKGGSYVTGLVTPPLEVSVVVGPAGGQCAEATFGPASCSEHSGVATCD